MPAIAALPPCAPQLPDVPPAPVFVPSAPPLPTVIAVGWLTLRNTIPVRSPPAPPPPALATPPPPEPEPEPPPPAATRYSHRKASPPIRLALQIGRASCRER